MQTATLVLSRTSSPTKLDVRQLWYANYRQARAMVRDRQDTAAATAYAWFLQHARRRFTTPAGWRAAQAAGKLVFERRIVGRGACGTVVDLERQGLVRRTRRPRKGDLVGVIAYRAASYEYLRDCGLSFAWGHDRLAAATGNMAILRQRARELRASRAVAREMARDRLALDGRDRIALTVPGLLALRAAEAARA